MIRYLIHFLIGAAAAGTLLLALLYCGHYLVGVMLRAPSGGLTLLTQARIDESQFQKGWIAGNTAGHAEDYDNGYSDGCRDGYSAGYGDGCRDSRLLQ